MNLNLDVKPKRIHVFNNGNPSERIFFIHPKCRISWSSIINFISDLLKPQKGPIRMLRKVNGDIVSSYDELEENGKYVACGMEPLVYLSEGYRTDSEIEFQKELQEASSSEIMRAVGKKVHYLTDTNQMKIITIYVFLNGQKTKPNKISLLETDLERWATILSIISKQLYYPVKYLYTIFGEKLKETSEIQHRGFYVALSEGSKFDNISYLSVFSTTRERKVRFKQTTQQTTHTEDSVLNKDVPPPNEVKGREKCCINRFTSENTSNPSIQEDTRLIRSREVIDLNDPHCNSPCIHVTIVQKPFSATNYAPGVPATVCAKKPSARLIVEMLGEDEHEAKCQICKHTQTSNVFCEAVPKGQCVIEVASKKFHIICDDDTIVLPCGTYFSSRKAMKNPYSLSIGNDTISMENIADHIVGIIVDTSELCVTKAIYGVEHTVIQDMVSKIEAAHETLSRIEVNSLDNAEKPQRDEHRFPLQ